MTHKTGLWHAPVYLTVTIDTECDKGPKWHCKNPLSFEGIHHGVGQVLQPVFQEFGARPTYLLSSEVIRDPASRALFATMSGDEAELGTHLHGEFAESSERVPLATLDFQRNYGEALERAKLVQLTHDFEQAFGHAPRSFRAGRFGIGEHSLGILQSLGYEVDSSVTPHMNWASSGAPGLDFRGAPMQPYAPDLNHPGKPGTARILEVPVTVNHSFGSGLPLVGTFFEPDWLRPTKVRGSRLQKTARRAIANAAAASPEQPVVLTCMFHNVEVTPGMSPYAQTEAQAQSIVDSLRSLLAFARSTGIRVVGLGELPRLLGHASS